MTLIFADRVKETTTSTGTSPLTLAGAVAGFEPFSSVCADGDTAYYCVTDGTSWEVGLGTYAAGVLTRTSVLSSSNAGAAVSLNPGSKDVFLTVPAAVIEALQALSIVYVGPSSGWPVIATDGQIAIITDVPGPTFFYQIFVWFSGDWQIITALDSIRAIAGTYASIIASSGSGTGQIAFATDQSNKAYVWDGGNWQEFIAKDPTARSSAATAASDAATALGTANDAIALALTLNPTFGSGTPAATGQPTDGSVINYFDSSASPYVHYVFNPGDGAFHQVA